MQGQNINIDEAIEEHVSYNHPLIMCFGTDFSSLTDPKVIIERKQISVPSMLVAVEYMLAAYYVYNIKFHKNSKPLCHLLEFLYGMTMSCKTLPLSIQPVIEGIMK